MRLSEEQSRVISSRFSTMNSESEVSSTEWIYDLSESKFHTNRSSSVTNIQIKQSCHLERVRLNKSLFILFFSFF